MKIDSFVRMYHGRGIEDWGSGKSDEFKAFAKDFRTMMRHIAKSLGADLVGFTVGHYDVSGFLETGGRYCYFSYSVPRGEYPIDCTAKDALQGILVREAKDARDYRGGQNRFCNFDGLQKLIEEILKGGR